MKEKVVLAHPGSLILHSPGSWLKETFDYDVVCCCVTADRNELDGLKERAKMSGASKLYIEDIVDEFCDDFIMPCVEAGAACLLFLSSRNFHAWSGHCQEAG